VIQILNLTASHGAGSEVSFVREQSRTKIDGFWQVSSGYELGFASTNPKTRYELGFASTNPKTRILSGCASGSRES
jgi:hypothetical protein